MQCNINVTLAEANIQEGDVVVQLWGHSVVHALILSKVWSQAQVCLCGTCTHSGSMTHSHLWCNYWCNLDWTSTDLEVIGLLSLPSPFFMPPSSLLPHILFCPLSPNQTSDISLRLLWSTSGQWVLWSWVHSSGEVCGGCHCWGHSAWTDIPREQWELFCKKLSQGMGEGG